MLHNKHVLKVGDHFFAILKMNETKQVVFKLNEICWNCSQEFAWLLLEILDTDFFEPQTTFTKNLNLTKKRHIALRAEITCTLYL